MLSLGREHLLPPYYVWGLPILHRYPPRACELVTHFQVHMKVVAGSSPLGLGPHRTSLGRLQVGSVKWKLPPKDLGAVPTHSPVAPDILL